MLLLRAVHCCVVQSLRHRLAYIGTCPDEVLISNEDCLEAVSNQMRTGKLLRVG